MLGRLRHLRSIPLTFLIVLLGFQVSPAFKGLNLCIGAGGHMEIETGTAGCCPSKSTLATESSLVQEAGTCASCIDVSLGGHETNTLAISTGSSNEISFPAPSLLERLNPLQATPVTPDRNLPTAPSLTAIRSVVLRV